MWFINSLLLIVGTVAGVCGVSFYVRNRKAAGRMRFYIFSYGICSAIWCISFGLIGLCDDLNLCYALRKVGDIGIVTFLIAETFLATDISGADKKIADACKSISIVLGVADYLIYAQNKVNTFIRVGNVTTWIANPEGAFNRAFHSGYIALTFLMLFSFAIVWYRNNKAKRLRRFLDFVFVSNFTMLFFSLPDTFLPAFGKPAVATSGLGAAFCAIVMWYGATQLGSFDIRMGNLRDKLFDLIEAGVIVLDTDKKIALINRYAADRMRASQVYGDALEKYIDIPEEDAQAMLAASENEIVEAKLRNADKTRTYSVRLSAVKDRYREVFCYVCVFVDVTEEVEAKEKAIAAGNAKSSFLAQMSHEIRTPINAVLGMNEMILRESKDASILDYASNIQTAGKTLLSLINSILDFSKIEEGKMEIVPVLYDTTSVISNLVASISERAKAKNLELIVEADPALPARMVGDDVRLSQVIMNLLTNAVKYTEKGSVRFSIQGGERKDGEIALQVQVEDTGIGIKQEDLPKLFESFERLDEVRNHNIEGTGLGMSIVTRLLGMMGSRLEVESVYGKGSVFSFSVRQKIADDTPIGDYSRRLDVSRSSVGSETLRAEGACVLVVDDNDMNLKVAKNLLKLFGITPDLVESGMEAIGRLRTGNVYHVILLDHMMPKMDGIETLQRMREESLLSGNTPVIALTANAINGAKEQYLQAGFDDYLSKPIDVMKLEQLLVRFLPKELCSFKESAEEKAAASNSIAELSQAGFETESGLRYAAGDPDFYLELASGFAESTARNQSAIRLAWQRQDWADYQIRVHALKSTARQIGANELSDLALQQELAAKDRLIPEIEAGAENLLQRYEQTAERLRTILHLDADTNETADTKKEISVEDLLRTLREAKTCMDNFEAESALEVLRSLASCTFADSAVGDALREITDALENFDTFTAEERLETLLQRIED